MTAALVLAASLYFLFLFREANQVKAARKRLIHVIHVNGTRGKSTVSRMIEAGLRAGGFRVFCKTTGTDPMTIDVAGKENLIRRRGRANIKEQIGILRDAAAQDAQILVAECMAIHPELQYVTQNKILYGDIGVITNVRRDHTDVMGERLCQIAESLCNTIPYGGTVFTAEENCTSIIERRTTQQGSKFFRVWPQGDEEEFDFPENVALALAVCEHLGVPRETALGGIRQFRRDPYALSLHRFGRAIFVNGFSINDVQSVCAVWRKLCAARSWENNELILLINNRADRGGRTQDMLEACVTLKPAQVWLLGASQAYMAYGLHKRVPSAKVCRLKDAKSIDPGGIEPHQILFAIGNIAGEGRKLMERVRKEGEALV